jgi:hypothetical protein
MRSSGTPPIKVDSVARGKRERLWIRNIAFTLRALFRALSSKIMARMQNTKVHDALIRTQEASRLPVDDYSAALRNAVSWLGERYLLAVPVTRSEQATPRFERLDVKR